MHLLSDCLRQLPAANETGINFPPVDGFNQPKRKRAARVANSSAEVHAYCAPLATLKRNGASCSVMSKANHLFFKVVHSQPAMTTRSSVHLASARNWSTVYWNGLWADTKKESADNSFKRYCKTKMTVSGSLASWPRVQRRKVSFHPC